MNDRLTGLVPHPASVRSLPGTLALTTLPAIVAAARDAALAAALSRALAAIPWPEGAASTEGPQPALTVEAGPGLQPEAYRLTIADTGIKVEAGGAPGAFYAGQTLRQLLPAGAWRAATISTASQEDWRLPCAVITDAPALAWRGAHLDVARHFFPKREILALIDAFAALKLNRLHLHLTDDQGWRIESRRYPALHQIGSHRSRTRLSPGRDDPVYDGTPHGGYYTLADLAEINAYAAQRMITVVPEIEVPGHASALLAACPELGAGAPPPGGYQVLADWGIFPYLMSPLPRTRDFLRDVFGELLEAVPAPYVHIGGDECVLDAWRDDPEVDAYRRRRGLARAAELHAAFLREVADLLADDFGTRAVVWDEGFASADGTPQRLRPDTIVMAWRGMGIARRAAVAGHDVIAAPVLPTYFDYFQSDDDTEPGGIGGPLRLEDVAAFAPVPEDWPETARQHLIGTQFQVWTEYIATSRELEYMIFPRACALADVAWSGRPVPVDGRLAAHLRRLDAAGLEYRPLSGPRPEQVGGTGARRHRPGAPIGAVTVHLDQLASGGS
ncbi:MAG TPA: beta-N-acetylhexosaminidase [Streptosporangiaceae bacterium]